MLKSFIYVKHRVSQSGPCRCVIDSRMNSLVCIRQSLYNMRKKITEGCRPVSKYRTRNGMTD